MAKKVLSALMLAFFIAFPAVAEEQITADLIQKMRVNLTSSEVTARRALATLAGDLSHADWVKTNGEINRLAGEVKKHLDKAEDAVEQGQQDSARKSLRVSAKAQIRLLGLMSGLIFQVGEKTGKELEELNKLLPKKEGI